MHTYEGTNALDALREIVPVTKPVQGSIRPPGSKSLTNRALICAALSNGRSTLIGSLDSDDTRVMVRALQSLGIAIDADWRHATLNVDGGGGVLGCQASCTDPRTAYHACGDGQVCNRTFASQPQVVGAEAPAATEDRTCHLIHRPRKRSPRLRSQQWRLRRCRGTCTSPRQ